MTAVSPFLHGHLTQRRVGAALAAGRRCRAPWTPVNSNYTAAMTIMCRPILTTSSRPTRREADHEILWALRRGLARGASGGRRPWIALAV